MRGEADRSIDGHVNRYPRRMLPGGWWILAALLLAACQRSPQASEEARSFEAICAGLDNSYECAQAIERRQLEAPSNSDRVTRRAGALVLQLADGRSVTMADEAALDDPSVVRYSFREHLSKVGYFVLHRQLYEGQEYVAVHDRTGRIFALPGVPIVSPDGTRMVSASAGLSGGYAPNVVEIWAVTSSGLVKEYDVSPSEWEPLSAAWVDPQAIRLETRGLTDGAGDTPLRTLHLRRRNGRWVLDQP